MRALCRPVPPLQVSGFGLMYHTDKCAQKHKKSSCAAPKSTAGCTGRGTSCTLFNTSRHVAGTSNTKLSSYEYKDGGRPCVRKRRIRTGTRREWNLDRGKRKRKKRESICNLQNAHSRCSSNGTFERCADLGDAHTTPAPRSNNPRLEYAAHTSVSAPKVIQSPRGRNQTKTLSHLFPSAPS